MDADEIQQEIERTREQLGQTVDELAAKADVKARAKEKATEMVGKAREKAAGARGKAMERTAATRGKARARAIAARGKAVELSGRVRPGQIKPGQIKPGQLVPGKLVPSRLLLGRLMTRRWRIAVGAAVAIGAIGSVVARRRRDR